MNDTTDHDGADALLFFKKHSTSFQRAQGRLPKEMRCLKLELGTLPNADGSANLSCGNSQVLCAIHGPIEAPLRFQLYDRARLKIYLKRLVPIPELEISDREKEEALRDLFSNIILTHLFPRTTISIVVHVLFDDGGIYAHIINAIMHALLDSSIPMRAVVSASSVSVIDLNMENYNTNNNDDQNDGNNDIDDTKRKGPKCEVILDPDFSEETDHKTKYTVTAAYQGTGLQKGSLLFCATLYNVNYSGLQEGYSEEVDSYQNLLRTCKEATEKLAVFSRIAMEQSLKQDRVYNIL